MSSLIRVTNSDDQLIGVYNSTGQNVALSNDSAIVIETTDHTKLINRNEPDQHMINSITNLQETLDEIQNEIQNVTNDKTYIYIQLSPSSVWTIIHNLNKFPSVIIIDSADSVVVGDIKYIDTNTLEVKFSSAFSGKAYLN